MTETLATAKVTHRFAASPERVYDAWLDPAKVRVWMSQALKGWELSGEMKRVEIDARVGGQFFFSDMRPDGEAKHWGTYQVLERPRKIVFNWIVDESQEDDLSIVTITIEPDGAGSLVTIVHEKIFASYLERTEMGWSAMLRNIDAMLKA